MPPSPCAGLPRRIHWLPFLLFSAVSQFLIVLNGSVPAFAQAVNELGVKPYGSYYGSEYDVVNVSNGHLELRIPIIDFPQRGGKLKLTFIARYNNAVWNETHECTPAPGTQCNFSWGPSNGFPGVQFAAEQVTPSISSFCISACSTNSPFLAYSVVMADGSTHPAGHLSGNLNESIDATGMLFDPINGNLTLSDGTRYLNMYSGNPVEEDTNGNQIFWGPPIGDSMGRTIPLTPYTSGQNLVGNTTSDFTGCTGLLPIAAAALWSVPGSNGATETFKFCFANVTIFTNHTFHTSCTGSSHCSQPNGPIPMLQSIVLPDGTAWTFDYTQPDSSGVNWGELAKITFPTGGSISYTWNHYQGCARVYFPPASTTGAVISRTVNANDGTGAHQSTYSTLGGPGATVIDPIGNETVYTFTDLNQSCSYFETQRQYYSGLQTSGTLLKTVTTDYSWSVNPYAPSGSVQAHPPMNVVPIRHTTTLANGLVQKVEYSYDAGFTFGGTATGIYGQQTLANEFDYANGSPGPLVRSTATSYLWQTNSNYITYNVLDVPSSVTISDGSGHQMAQTTSGYDEALPASSGITVSHDTNPANGNIRGNLTSVNHWLNGTASSTPNCPVSVSNGFITQTKRYLDTGMVSQSSDGCGNSSTFQYAATPYNGAYPTQACDALNHCTTMTYNLNPGLIGAVTDPNGNTTGHTYDNIGRLTNISYPDGGQTNYSYPSATEIDKSVQVTSSLPDQSKFFFDGLGRASQTQHVTPGGTATVVTSYDGLGRVASVTNPYFSSSDPTYGVTQTQYDPLNRITQVTRQDSSVVTTQYDLTSANSADGECTITTDEAAKVRKSCVDGLGQLIEVDEPQASSGTLGTPYITLYGYDTLGNLLSVNQKGDGSQAARVRSFTYDSLSRLLTASNPESGTISYIYDANGNLLQKTSPAANQTGSAKQTISYCYDKLNRVSGKAYSAQSCPLTSPVVTYAYDAGTNGIGHLTSLTDQPGSGSYSYDVMGRILSESRTIAGNTKNLAYSYYLNGSAQNITYPSGAIVSYMPWNNGTVATAAAQSAIDGPNSINYVTGSGGPGTGAAYGPDGSGLTYNNGWTPSFAGIANSFSYNSRLQPVNMQATSPGTTGTNSTASVTISGSLNSSQTGDAARSGSALASYVRSGGFGTAFYFDGNNHVIGVSPKADGTVQGQDLTAMSGAGAALASSALATYGNYAVVYQAGNGDINQIWWNASNSTWVNNDLGGWTNVAPATRTAIASFLGLGGALEIYVGQDNHIHDLYYNSSSGTLSDLDLTSLSGGPAAMAGSALATYGNYAVVYQAGNGDINQIWWNASNSTWVNNDLGGWTNVAPATRTAIASFLGLGGALEIYVGQDNHIHDLYYNSSSGTLSDLDLTSLSGGPAAMAGSALATYGNYAVVYQAGNGDIHQIWWNASNSTWVDNDLTMGNSVAPATRTALTAWVDPANNTRIAYEATSSHVYELLWNGSSLANIDMTANVVLDSGTVSLEVGDFTASACFGPSTNPACSGQPANNDPAQVASALASALNVSGSPVTAVASGATISMTWKATGLFTTPVGALTTTHDNPNLFPNPSFTSSATNFSGGSGANLSVFNISYNFNLGNGDNGNVIGITNNRDSTRSQSFTYDALNRLTSAQNAGTDCTQNALNSTKFWGNNYTYDSWGNLLTKSVTKCSSESLTTTADSNNRIHSTSGADYQYDAAGNMTTNVAGPLAPQTYTYDAENRITGAGGYTYTYDAEGNRVEKSNGSTGTIYWYMTPGIVAESDLSGNLKSEYIFFNGDRVARKDFPSGAVSYYFSDHLKTASVITDSAGNIKEDEDYYPWGGEIQFANGDTNHYKFTGNERDAETGLDYFGARYYGNWLGRFSSPDDPLIDQDFENPQSLNLYTYALNNPVRFGDADGRAVTVCVDREDGGQSCYIVSNDTYARAQAADQQQGIKAPELGHSGYIFCGEHICGQVQYGCAECSADAITPLGLGPGDLILFGPGRSLFGGMARSAAEEAAEMSAKMAGVRAAGKAGEIAAGIVKNTERIPSLTGTAAFRVPDILNKTAEIIGDVKNIPGKVSLTNQIRDQIAWAAKNGYQFVLKVPQSTTFTKPLQDLIDRGVVKVIRF